ncbi:MAG: RluA family pseudouridine synthase [Candidatus Izemoplasmataceae bacterium]
MTLKTIHIDESDHLNRLDKVITKKDETMTRTAIKHLIEEAYILVNDEETKPSYKVKTGDVITIKEKIIEPLTITPVDLDLEFIYEDDDLIVVNKPSGLVVHPSHTVKEATLVHGILAQANVEDDASLRPGIVHRIDKETSGLLVVAKNKDTLLALQSELKARKTEREYIALVEGVIPHNNGKIDAPIGRDTKDRKLMSVTEKGKASITYFRVLERFDEHTLVACKLESGRTHQIRVHMQYIKHPIVGDPKYGHKKTDTTYGQYLHAESLGFTHPKTKEFMTFKAPLPEFFISKLESLRKS